ncbi:hypothetical protein HDV05_005054 [Chytridiales sp. JEL 0842]|nr:hypothetical protein HDV05_005054 [Chytridiales sp. JEL 0842]
MGLEVVNLTRSTPSLLINDSLAQPATPFINHLIAQSDAEVVVFCSLETSEASLQRLKAVKRCEWIHLNLALSLFSWTKDNSNDCCTLPTIARNLTEIVESKRGSKKVLIVVDSLNPLEIQYGVHEIAGLVRDLDRLTSESTRLIACYHLDSGLPSSTSISLPSILNQIATTHITLSTFAEWKSSKRKQKVASLEGLEEGLVVYDLLHKKKKSGKVTRENAGMHFENQTCVLYDLEQLLETPPTIAAPPERDPTSNLSFNLKLTETQREAKEGSVLPYLKVHDKSGEGSALIHYQADAADDSEEDPDDDLDI